MVNYIFNSKRNSSKFVCTRRSTVLSLPFYQDFPGSTKGTFTRQTKSADFEIPCDFKLKKWLETILGLESAKCSKITSSVV